MFSLFFFYIVVVSRIYCCWCRVPFYLSSIIDRFMLFVSSLAFSQHCFIVPYDDLLWCVINCTYSMTWTYSLYSTITDSHIKPKKAKVLNGLIYIFLWFFSLFLFYLFFFLFCLLSTLSFTAVTEATCLKFFFFTKIQFEIEFKKKKNRLQWHFFFCCSERREEKNL